MFAPNYMCKRQSLSNIWITWIRVCEMKKRKGGWVGCSGPNHLSHSSAGNYIRGWGSNMWLPQIVPAPDNILPNIYTYFQILQIFSDIYKYFQIFSNNYRFFKIFSDISQYWRHVFKYFQIFTNIYMFSKYWRHVFK